ncbi:hypothetical protein SSYRP_v1c06200 [Spiroplasma syrphidicola EA-1]|uniref:Uncharacterized protein n=1 Tax=Spiroplasma syrphidicola EA-1 TaxID=1276229 RepID=R4UJA7_9MOLU|nr:hypothetical protein [Spiroplasma syrphidicola]AGM26210.1 hypothetical protein SSYRP_v1c06200 [Spiroplasma syrphidicola EA-1]
MEVKDYNGSQFYNSVIKELTLITENEHITSNVNPVFSLKVKVYYLNKNVNNDLATKDKMIAELIQEKTSGLERTIIGIVKEFADLHYNVYKKEADLHYMYLKFLKEVKIITLENYGSRLNYVRTFYYRYLEWMAWTEQLNYVRTDAKKMLRSNG